MRKLVGTSIVFDDLSNNVVLPINPRTGGQVKWPAQVKVIRRGGLD